MRLKLKVSLFKMGLFAASSKAVTLGTYILFFSILIAYFVTDKETFIYYVVKTAVNQLFTFVLFGTGFLMVANVYLLRLFPTILDEFRLIKDKAYFIQESDVYLMLLNWRLDLSTKPIGFNSLGKELLIRDFILNEIRVIELALYKVASSVILSYSRESFLTSKEICELLREHFLRHRLRFDSYRSDSFINRLTIDPHAKLPFGRQKEIFNSMPEIFIQKYTNACSDFNIFLSNSIDSLDRRNLSRYDTLNEFYHLLNIALFSYKDNLLPNFVNEFNGDLAQYHLRFDGIPLVK